APGGGLDRRHVAADGPGKVKGMAAAREEVPSASAPVQEPGPALGRPDARPDQEPDLLAREQSVDVVEEVERMPLVADRADGSGALGRRDNRPGILERAGDRFLQVYRQAAAERRDRWLTVGQWRGGDPPGAPGPPVQPPPPRQRNARPPPPAPASPP